MLLRGTIREWVLMFAGTAVGCATLSGCSGTGCKPPPCPPVFEVHTWCGSSGKCTFDGVDVGAACDAGGCRIPAGKTLRVPVAAFADQLPGRHQLGVKFFAAPSALDPTQLKPTLDGVSGTSLPAIQDEVHMEDIAFDFAPFPNSPLVLEIRHTNAVIAASTSWFFFLDQTCYQANPRFNCGK